MPLPSNLSIGNGFSVSKDYPYQFLNFISYEEMEKWICQSDVVLTHGGGGTVFLALHHLQLLVLMMCKLLKILLKFPYTYPFCKNYFYRIVYRTLITKTLIFC